MNCLNKLNLTLANTELCQLICINMSKMGASPNWDRMFVSPVSGYWPVFIYANAKNVLLAQPRLPNHYGDSSKWCAVNLFPQMTE